MSRSNTSACLREALRYSRLGLAIFPSHGVVGNICTCGSVECGSPGKHPRIREWQKLASTDETVIRKWWKAWPTANVCIATGRMSGLVVIDVDPRHGGDESLIQLTGVDPTFAETPTSRTGGGGCHFFFAYPGRRTVNRVNLLPGIDLRGDGGFVVVPPSLHVSGKEYSWIRPLLQSN